LLERFKSQNINFYLSAGVCHDRHQPDRRNYANLFVKNFAVLELATWPSSLSSQNARTDIEKSRCGGDTVAPPHRLIGTL